MNKDVGASDKATFVLSIDGGNTGYADNNWGTGNCRARVAIKGNEDIYLYGGRSTSQNFINIVCFFLKNNTCFCINRINI